MVVLQVVVGGQEIERAVLGVHASVESDLVVAAARGVKPAASGTDALGEDSLDRHVDVLIGDAELELAVADLAVDLREPRLDGVGILLRDDLAVAASILACAIEPLMSWAHIRLSTGK